jgi:hypothetical protein
MKNRRFTLTLKNDVTQGIPMRLGRLELHAVFISLILIEKKMGQKIKPTPKIQYI